MTQVTIVSNRLPVSVKKVAGKLQFYPSAGGLATGLVSYTKDKKNKWVGWPGIVSEELSDEDMAEISKELEAHNCYPVFLTQKQIEGFYNGYSNSILWPLFHNMHMDVNDLERYWRSYHQVNILFAEAVMGLSQPESTIWIHDYQLLLVPEMIREERPKDLIGFFLHIPFPSPKTLKKLPQAKKLLKALLGSDLIGFHTDIYVQDFLDCCQEMGIATPGVEQVQWGGRVVRVTAFPLGIDYTKFSQAGTSSVVRQHIRAQRKKYGKRRKIILTVDRLDPTKGFIERLSAYKELLHQNKHLHKKVVMVMLAVPSRADIEAYKKLKENVEELVEDINRTFGKRRWKPVHYMYQSVPFEELAALYRVADVAFIAPIKDGMNLVAKEYIASTTEKQGMLVLSETAGAAQELSHALLVNPRQPASLVTGLTEALSMSPKELQERLKNMKQRLSTNTVHHWKRSFMSTLQSPALATGHHSKRLVGNAFQRMLEDFMSAKNPTILLDYDGVMAPFKDKPSAAKPSPATLKLLKQLADQVGGGVLVISGRHRNDLEEWLGKLPLTLAAEHGALIRPRGETKWRTVIHVRSNWKKLILPVLQKYADKTPGAFVEEKECSLVWHYRQASPFYTQKYGTILRRALKPLLKPMGLNIYRGNMILEVKSPEANKGVAARHWLKKKHDFVLAIGDDYTDEDMFAVMPSNAYTVKVGRGSTLARFRLKSVDEVTQLLESLAKAKRL